MRLVVVGRAHEVAGFALAGVETAVCSTDDEAETLVSSLAAPGEAAGLILVAPWVDRSAQRVIAAVRRRKGPPVIVSLPGSGEIGD
jgi:vacuolar-type H+-ATPase subunit F/Vma7